VITAQTHHAGAAHDDGLVFRALADPTRRRILDSLFKRDGRTLGELQVEIPSLTRFGVMTHLRVLEKAGLLTTRKSGRFKYHYLDAATIGLIYARWVHKYLQPAVGALRTLKRRLEEGNLETARPRHVNVVFVRTTAERLWQAITDPEFTKQYWYGAANRSDWKPGSRWTSQGPAGELYLDGEVLESNPPRRLVHSFHVVHDSDAAAEAPTKVTWEIEAQEGGICRLTVTHDGFTSEDSPTFLYSNGWPWILSGLKTVLETGRQMVVSA
jgi:uncharacterized protein YndB with AHSA1/START domain/DNA-binding transcriptional ArsR family regulator